jgi:hypothetical protein
MGGVNEVIIIGRIDHIRPMKNIHVNFKIHETFLHHFAII